VEQHLDLGLGCLIVEVSTTHTHTHTHILSLSLSLSSYIDLTWTSDQLVAQVATYTTHNKYKGRKSMLSAGFEKAIAAINRPQT